MTEAEVRELLAPISAALNGIKTGYDGTVYDTPGEAVREQINDLHVLIGDEPGTAIQASAVAYNNSNVAAELTAVNGRLDEQGEIVDRLNEGGLDIKDDVIEGQITEWLNDHPEATTTVQDGVISEAKLASALKPKIMNAYVTPEMYGAVGDGVADDTNAIQAAIDSGNIVIFPAKTYLVTNLFVTKSKLMLIGSARGTVIKSNSAGYILTVGNQSVSVGGISISYIDFNCNQNADGISLTGYRVNRFVIEDCSIEYFKNYGFHVDTSTGYIYLNRCRFYSGVSDSVYVCFAKSLQDIPVNYVYVTNCYFEYGTNVLENPIVKTGLLIKAGRVFYINNCDFCNWQSGNTISISAEHNLSDIKILNSNFYNISNSTCVFITRKDSAYGLYGITLDGNTFYGSAYGGGKIVDTTDTDYIIFGLMLQGAVIEGTWGRIYTLKKVTNLFLNSLDRPILSIVASALCTYEDCQNIHLPNVSVYKNQIIPAGETVQITAVINDIPYPISAYIPYIYIDHQSAAGVTITGTSYNDATGECTVTLTNTATGPRNIKLKFI
jgi:hypothetical protein